MNILDKIAHYISGRNREKKYMYFISKLAPQAGCLILDVGASNREYRKSDNYLEKKFPYHNKIVALCVGRVDEFRKRYPRISCVLYDGATFPFKEKCFEICWSNAVIEHVGGYEKQLKFIREIRRVAKRAFITTPNKHFPVEVHTKIVLLHFLPTFIFDVICRILEKGWATGNYMNLLRKKDILKLLKEADIVSYEIRANKIYGFALDFTIIF